MSGDELIEYNGSLNDIFQIDRYISLRDQISYRPPDFLSKEISKAFEEGAACFTIQCYNAAATMFRLFIDLVTRPLLPDIGDNEENQPNSKQRRDLGLRLQWLFDNNKLDQSLRELAQCIREDANDGAHVGNLSKEDSEDILDFTTTLLERLVAEPARLKQAELRRSARRQPTK
jgi:Domain of unknown function (DUF4145)